MPIKDAIRICTCKYCNKKFTMFTDKNGELVFFPENTIRPAYGYYELLDHLKTKHPEIFHLYSFLSKLLKENVEECYVISR